LIKDKAAPEVIRRKRVTPGAAPAVIGRKRVTPGEAPAERQNAKKAKAPLGFVWG
jgi:hypothetical protein